ncbi:MAG: hypothetical protein JMN24_01140 [gamma proteobacterium endosymbiont of Lamellibrachia anaximandri]|nr:hypothetical protein [gamma proteobacterium endosymbiont of Lamellibrachia anaximandri]MBL3618094.1 hypothetical protein [gamma proteobacterium endosymbiont of Lamellibrachia anaximandri]
MKRLAVLLSLIFVATVALAEKPKPVTIQESVALNVNLQGTPRVEIKNTTPIPVALKMPPDADVLMFSGSCNAPCYDKWEEIGWENATDSKVLVLTDMVFTNGSWSENPSKRLRASVLVLAYQGCTLEEPGCIKFQIHVSVPRADTRSLHLQTGLRVYPGDYLAIALFEGAYQSSVSAIGRLEDF